MGKNRKPRNVVQGQIQNALETEKCKDIPRECVSSDASSPVKKRDIGKCDAANKLNSTPQFNLVEKSFTAEGNDTILWTPDSNGITDGNSSTNAMLNQLGFEENFQTACNQEIFESEKGINLKKNCDQELLNLISIPCSENVPTAKLGDNEQFECVTNVKESDHMLFNDADDLKKQNVNSHNRSVDELEITKELEDDNQKSQISLQSSVTMCASASCFDQSCQYNQISSGNSNDNSSKDTLSACVELKLQKDKLENTCTNNINVVEINSSCGDSQNELKPMSNDYKSKSSSLKKKERRAKAKLKKLNCQTEVLCSTTNDHLNTENDANLASSTEEKNKLKSISDANKGGKKRPNKKQLAAIHEALRKAKEEEERQRKEEENRQKMAEEAERIRLEKIKIEQEKKEMKKLKEKKRKEKAKAEGRLLSKSEKQSRARMEATLAALRQQGIDVPQIFDKKPSGSHGPRLGNCKNFPRKRFDSCQSTQSTDSAIVVSERQKYESYSSQESSGKDSLSDFPSSLDLTEDSGITPEFDKGIFSCSEESDDNIISSKKNRKESESKVLIEKNTVKTSLSYSQSASESDTRENTVKLRSPVVCVLGHVDTGKTKILDHIRKTHVQDSEAGGITQQIGATMIPRDALKEKCKMVKNFSSFNLKIPGLLVIDTPGHESFSNLRFRGSSICDIAVLVVDIMHGLEPQTIESINLLKERKTPFIVALNKVDRIYGWQSSKDDDIETTIKNQSVSTQQEFLKRCQRIIVEFANQCLNAALFYENKDPRSFLSMVPTSAVTGDGMGNILSLIAQLTQSIMPKKLIFSEELEATVLEVKVISGLGTTIDVILVNGRLREGDTIVLAGQEGPIVTQIRSLLMPQSLKELRVKNPYIEHKVVEGAQGVKITGKDLEKSIAGLPLFVAQNHTMIDCLKNELNSLHHDAMCLISTSERGVYVQASTLGSLEALLEFLSSSGIPYFSVKIGPVVKKDVVKASVMLEHDVMYAAILAFDVKVERDAQELADSLGVRIFQADIIYHLFDMYDKYREELNLKRKQFAVFPCKLKILPDFVFSAKDPLVLGVHIEAGTLKEGTPICVVNKDIIDIGTVSSIEVGNNKANCAKKGEDVRITIKLGDSPKTYGKHFSHEDILLSHISRQSIDACKDYYRSELQSSDWHLMVELKKLFHIM